MNAQLKHAEVPQQPQIYAAIAKIIGDIGKAGISKERNNQQQGYKFRGIDDVYNALSPFLASAGLVILPRVLNRTVTERQTQKGGVLFYVVLDVEFDFVCASDCSRHTIRVPGEAMDSGDKATNKAMSAAYKYACMQAFCIPTEGNPDADQDTHDIKPAEDESRAHALNMLAIIEKPAPEGDHEGLVACLEALEYHNENFAGQADLYRAVYKHLEADKRAAWKKLVEVGKAHERNEKAIDKAGVKF